MERNLNRMFVFILISILLKSIFHSIPHFHHIHLDKDNNISVDYDFSHSHSHYHHANDHDYNGLLHWLSHHTHNNNTYIHDVYIFVLKQKQINYNFLQTLFFNNEPIIKEHSIKLLKNYTVKKDNHYQYSLIAYNTLRGPPFLIY